MASNDSQIQIEIVLEDGSVQKGFVNLAKQANNFKKSVETGVGEGTEKAAKKSAGALEVLGSQFTRLSNLAGPIGKTVATITALAGATTAFTIAAAKIDEEIKAINDQFDNLANRAGGAAGMLRASFTETARGLVDLDDVLKSSNRTLGALDISAQALADNFKVARQATVAFGVDTITAYEALNQAIITGNTRGLRQLGLFIDSTEAVKAYAKELGVAAQFLSETGKQQAIANAIAASAQTVFAGINEAQEKTSDSASRLSVSFNELKETAAGLLNQTLGTTAAATLNFFSMRLDALNRALRDDAPKTAAEYSQQLTQDISQLTKELEYSSAVAEKYKGTLNFSQFSVASDNVKRLSNNLQELRENQEALGMAEMRKAQATQNATTINGVAIQQTREQMIQNEALLQQQMQLQNQRLQMQMANAQFAMQNAQTEAAFEKAKQDAILAQDALYLNQRAALRKQYADAGLAGTQAERDALLALEQKHSDDKLKLIAQENASMVKLRGIVQAGIVNGLTNAFAGLGKALAKGQNGFEAFGKAVLGALGSMAIQIGSMLVAIGLGFSALGPVLPVFGLSGAAAVAAGLGLIVLGGALSAMGEGGETGAGTATASGGGVVGSGGTADLGAVADGSQLERAQPGTQIAVNIQGNVLDRRQTGLEIVEIIKEQFDTQGGQTLVGVT